MLDYLKCWWVWIIFIVFILIIICLYLHVTGQAYKPGQTKIGQSTTNKSRSGSLLYSKRLIKSSHHATPPSFVSDDASITSIPHENWVVNTFKATPLQLQLHDVNQRRNKKMSKGEVACEKAIVELFGEQPEVQVRLNKLTNPITHQPLELDFLLRRPDRWIGFEYHGRQHYEYVPFFHKRGEVDLYYQQWKDNLKIELCDKHEIYLITIPHWVPNHRIKAYIDFYLPEKVQARRDAGEDKIWGQ